MPPNKDKRETSSRDVEMVTQRTREAEEITINHNINGIEDHNYTSASGIPLILNPKNLCVVDQDNTRIDNDGEEEGGQEEEEEMLIKEYTLTREEQDDILGPETDTLCGIGRVRGRLLQKLAHPITYLVISSVVALVQGMFFTYSNATLSTVEKRFRLPSKISGFITTGNDIIQLLLSIHITFLAGQGHRPRWLAFGMFTAALGCFLAALPHFIFGAGDLLTQDALEETTRSAKELKNSVISKKSLLCSGVGNTSTCGPDSAEIGSEQYTVISLHLVAQMLGGFASMLYYTIGYSYLDEAVSKKRVPLFLAVSGSLRILGPVCGYSLASFSLSYWVNPALQPDLSPRHPRWIGAWWIGFLLIGCSLLVIAWSLVLLPKTLPGARRRKIGSLQEAAEKGKEALQNFAKTLRPAKSRGCGGVYPSVRRVLTNKVYVLIIINQVLFWFAFFGYITFKPKYLEHQFKMSAAKANQYIAGAAMAATLVGWLGTGSALTFFRPRAKFVLLFMVALSATNCVLHLCMVNVSCDHDVIHGMGSVLQIDKESQTSAVTPQTSKDTKFDVSPLSECSSACGCSGKFSPVCVNGNLNFYNPCYAGCSSSSKVNSKMIYHNCNCSMAGELSSHQSLHNDPKREAPVTAINVSSATSNARSIYNLLAAEADNTTSGSNLDAVDGYCRHDCPAFYMYLTLTVLTKMTHAASRVPVNLILFRCVDERDKDVGLGVFNAALALAASIPAPIVFGWAIDYACVLWEESCGHRGFCWLYDLNSYRYILHGIPAALMAGCLLTEAILLIMHKSIYLYGEEEKSNSDKHRRSKDTAENGNVRK